MLVNWGAYIRDLTVCKLNFYVWACNPLELMSLQTLSKRVLGGEEGDMMYRCICFYCISSFKGHESANFGAALECGLVDTP